jgi:hypothetical protein
MTEAALGGHASAQEKLRQPFDMWHFKADLPDFGFSRGHA